MTGTGRIRWEPTEYGGHVGYVATLESWVFQIWRPEGDGGERRLDSTLPGQFGRHLECTDPEPLKAEAERWLEEFTRSIGAFFPDAPGSDPKLREALRALRCVQAGWAFGVPEDSREQWLDLVVSAMDRMAPETTAPAAGKE